MAHGDYNCCAICDCKIDYAGDEATTKEEICEYCSNKLKKYNINNIEEFLETIKKNTKEENNKFLKEMEFCYCCYKNDVDNIVSQYVNLEESYEVFEQCVCEEKNDTRDNQ